VAGGARQVYKVCDWEAWITFRRQYESQQCAYAKLVFLVSYLNVNDSLKAAWLAVGARIALSAPDRDTSMHRYTWLLQPHQHGAAGAMLLVRNLLTVTPTDGSVPSEWEILANPAVTQNGTRHPFIYEVSTALSFIVPCMHEGDAVRAWITDAVARMMDAMYEWQPASTSHNTPLISICPLYAGCRCLPQSDTW
jgi:hypothetical protein